MNILIEGNNEFIKQQDELVTYAKKITRDEAKIDWKMTARETIAKINGLNPSPGVWFKHNENRIKIIEAEEINAEGKIGEVLTDDLIIACADKAIKIKKIQKEGKKKLSAENFLAGYKIVKGEVLS